MGHAASNRLVAAALVAALAAPLLPAHASPANAALTGRVVVAGTSEPLAGARVHVGDKRTRRIVTSGITSADGAFEVAGLPPAAYELAVESNGGLYVVGSPLPLGAGEQRSVQLVVAETPGAEGDPAAAAPKTSAASLWNDPLIATLVVVGVAVVVGLIVGNVIENEPASPSIP